jgi:hypothetical protein
MMKKIGQLIVSKGDLKKVGWDEKSIFYAFRRVIKEEYGSNGVINLVPDFWKNQTLFVRSDSATWGSELWLNKEKIIKKINLEIGSEEVKKLKIKT